MNAENCQHVWPRSGPKAFVCVHCGLHRDELSKSPTAVDLNPGDMFAAGSAAGPVRIVINAASLRRVFGAAQLLPGQTLAVDLQSGAVHVLGPDVRVWPIEMRAI